MGSKGWRTTRKLTENFCFVIENLANKVLSKLSISCETYYKTSNHSLLLSCPSRGNKSYIWNIWNGLGYCLSISNYWCNKVIIDSKWYRKPAQMQKQMRKWCKASENVVFRFIKVGTIHLLSEANSETIPLITWVMWLETLEISLTVELVFWQNTAWKVSLQKSQKREKLNHAFPTFKSLRELTPHKQEARLISSRERADVLVHLQVFALWFLQWTCRILLPLWELLADGTAL